MMRFGPSTTNSEGLVIKCVADWWKSSGASKFVEKRLRNGKGWSVLAAIIVESCGENVSADQSPQTISRCAEVVAVGIGTQCVGRKKLDLNGHVLHDSHAEVLAKRSFQRFLAQELRIVKSLGGTSNILEWNASNKKYRVREGTKIHLYTSQSPCGDAAIYEVFNDNVDSTKTSCIKDRPLKRIKRITGAKPLDAKSESMNDQVVKSLRTKPGKSTMLEPDRTYSMSCSDKVASWNVFGIQGALLFQHMDPIYLTSVVVTHDTLSKIEDQKEALHRALCYRIKDFSITSSELEAGFSLNSDCACVINDSLPLVTMGDDFPFLRPEKSASESRKSTSEFKVRPSPLGFNWCKNFESDSCTESFDFEATMGTSGLRQGANLKAGPTAKTRSRLSKSSALEQFFSIEQSIVDSSEFAKDSNGKALSYRDLKGKAIAYTKLKQRFREEWFRAWEVTPKEFNSWPVSQFQAKRHCREVL